jgi:rhodanese-related sulfurtransferase
MTVTELSSQLTTSRDLRLLDVRTAAEYENGHIAGAYNVPLDLLHEHAAELRKASGDVVLVCQSGRRAAQAEKLLQQSGMANMRVLDGGMQAWLGQGRSVARIRARVSLERQVRMVAGAMVALGSLAALTLSPLAAAVPLMIGCGLVFAGATDTCAMGMLLAKLPYNRGAACDTEGIVRQFLA